MAGLLAGWTGPPAGDLPVLETSEVAGGIPPHFAAAVIQPSLWAVHKTAFLSNCW